ncbi:hypothetical protein DFA_10076 [Cavenderia fasciculata]|uniref:Uncharacterized protein n=1 Tax=Cavenderia fasciculata TaxID=261658 RepID=F4Q973_CACFS|nr:uncharacterized protein DFA_10076 [Cavenderia fasciculata]EGG15242.1 hypothetical protein DFA_10076 [Cavenderia fasciculata]|eukprot:XP_004351962.1 hypothetical protein DFA_10076 [Cavenderia fasciculata]
MGVNQSTIGSDIISDGVSNNNNNNNQESSRRQSSPTTTTTGSTTTTIKAPEDELDQFMKSMNINKTSSDLDLMIAVMNDKLNKGDYETAYTNLKQFVFITIESLHRHCNNTLLADNADGSNTTYNAHQSSYLLPSLQKLEDLYQLVKIRCEESMRQQPLSNIQQQQQPHMTSVVQQLPKQQIVLYLCLMTSILQQLRSMLLRKIILVDSKDDKEQEEDEGLSAFVAYQSKDILQDCQNVIKDMLRVNQQLPNNNENLSVKIKAIDNCFTSLQSVLKIVVSKIKQSLQACNQQWAWNNFILEKNRKGLKLRTWQPHKMTITLHNQSSLYLDQIYTLICDRFKDNRINILFNEANSHLEDLILNLTNNQKVVDSIQYLLGVDELVDSLSAISDISFKYSNFILDNCNSTNKKIQEINKLKSRVQDILSNYISLESEYFQLSFSMALYLDDLGQLIINLKNQQMGIPQMNQVDKTIKEIETSTKVDDIFFVFRKVIQRALSTNSAPSVCATINLTFTSFDSLYLPYLEILLKQTYIGNFEDKRDYFLVILNDFTLTRNYIDQMQQELKANAEHTFHKNQDDCKMIISCIYGEAMTSLKTRMETMLKENVDKIFQMLTVPINQLCWPLRNIKYEINDQEYERYEINDPFVHDFMQGLDDLLYNFNSQMVDKNFDLLIHLISNHISITIEDHLKQQKFNFLGAMQISKDIRRIIEHLCSLTSEQNVRHKFAKLSQIVHLLTLDKPADVMDLWGLEGYQWKLSALDIKLVLARRSDFDLKSVHNLVLK